LFALFAPWYLASRNTTRESLRPLLFRHVHGGATAGWVMVVAEVAFSRQHQPSDSNQLIAEYQVLATLGLPHRNWFFAETSDG
jgi:hypothetical protein